MAVEEYFGGKTTGGASFGQAAADKVSLHGATPTTQDANIDDVNTSVFTTTPTSSAWGFANSAEVANIVTVVNDARTTINAILDALINKGIIASS